MNLGEGSRASSVDGDRLAAMERELCSDLQDRALAHRWLHQLERSSPALRDRPLVADLLRALSDRFPTDLRILNSLEERWAALGRDFQGRARVEDWFSEILRHSSEPPSALSNLGVLAVPALIRNLEAEDCTTRFGCIFALERMGPPGSGAFEALLDRLGSDFSSYVATTLFSIEPQGERAAERLRQHARTHPNWPYQLIYRSFWNLDRNPKTRDWLLAISPAITLSDHGRAELDEFLRRSSARGERWPSGERFRIAMARLIGDQRHYTRSLWQAWPKLNLQTRAAILANLRRWHSGHPRVGEAILEAFASGQLGLTQLRNWSWTSFRGALHLIPQLRAAANDSKLHLDSARALADLLRRSEPRLRDPREANKLRSLLETAESLALTLTASPRRSIQRAALEALALTQTSTYATHSSAAMATLRAALLSDEVELIDAAARAAPLVLNEQDHTMLATRARIAPRDLRKAIQRLALPPSKGLKNQNQDG